MKKQFYDNKNILKCLNGGATGYKLIMLQILENHLKCEVKDLILLCIDSNRKSLLAGYITQPEYDKYENMLYTLHNEIAEKLDGLFTSINNDIAE